MVKLKARTKTDLGKVHGFGEAKMATYGNDLPKILAEHLDKPSPEPAECPCTIWR